MHADRHALAITMIKAYIYGEYWRLDGGHTQHAFYWAHMY